jgi:GTP-binding protein
MFNLNATEEQLNFPTIYGSAKLGWMSDDWRTPSNDITPLLDSILENIPKPKTETGSLQLLITSLDYSSYVGRIAIGQLHRGSIKQGQMVSLVKRSGQVIRTKVKELLLFEGLGKLKVEKVNAGDICALVGIEGFDIGDTVADIDEPEALPTIEVDEPTMSMLFTINDSPFFGKEGKFVTSRHIKDRLDKELEKNLALKVKETDKADSFTVYGRGVLHLSILIETMRREGYELQVGQPKVIIKMVAGEKCEPIEILNIDLPDEFSGKAIEVINRRKGTLLIMERKADRIHLEFEIPARGIIGLRNILLTATAGEAVISHRFKGFEPYRGEIETRINGSLIALESGTAYAYAINKLQDRGKFFIDNHEEVYTGQVIGENNRAGDLGINVTKSKKLTNVRAAGSDEKIFLAPPIKFSLEEALEYIQEDEYVEVTPVAIRLRKIFLDENERKRRAKN